MEDIRVILYGVGSVGKGIVNTLRSKIGVKIVGAVSIEDVGQDVGIVSGGDPIGVTIVKDIEELVKSVKADVLIDVASPASVRETFNRVKCAIENNINIIAAAMEISNLWFTDPVLAKEIDDICKQYGVSFLGAGATQTGDRFILSMTEGSTEVKRISYTHHADVQAFSDDSNAKEWGITLTRQEYDEGVSNGTVKSKEDLKASIPYIADCLGWEIDEVTLRKELPVDENGRINAFTGIVEGFEDGVSRIQMSYEMVIDPERNYFDHLVIEGTPMVDAMVKYTPDRGMVATIGAIVNCIPCVVKQPAGYVSSLSTPANNIIYDDYRKHV